jgi:phosphoribosylaminoimidazole carboxylase PurE protein
MKKKNILVGIIMGSDSDIPIMKEAEAVCREFGVECEMTILSAHRTPDITAKYASGASGRGLKVIIAGAGGAAHLPGVIAAHFPLPVIGVPIKSRSLDGLDSLLSIVQMPPGVPVATVGINAAKNAGLLAMEILATGDKKIADKMADYKKKLEDESMKKNLKLKN